MKMNEKKKKHFKQFFKISLIFSLLISLFFLGMITGSKNARAGSNDIEYEFENDYLYNGALTEEENTFNTRNKTAVTGIFNGTDSFDYEMQEGYYYGTYSFRDNDEDSYISNPTTISFVNYALVGDNTDIQIKDVSNHDNVLSCISHAGATTTNLHHYFNPTGTEYRTNLISEFWFCLNDTTDTKWKSLTWKSGALNTAHIYFYTNDIKYYDGVNSITIGENALINNEWIHLKTVFNDTNDCFDVYLNDELIGNDCDSRGDMSAGCNILILQCALDTDIEMHFDAFGFSGDSDYTIGLNCNPYDVQPLLNGGYSIDSGYDSTINIVNLENHYNVLEIDSKGCTVQTIISDSLDNIPNGTIEFWFAVNETNEAIWRIVQIREYPYTMMTIVIVNNDIALYDGTTLTYYNNFIIANSWNHVKLTFDISTQDCNLYVNGLLRVESIGFQYTLQEGIDVFRVIIGANTDTKFYLDALGYSWDENYTIGENMFPYLGRIEETPVTYSIINGTYNEGTLKHLSANNSESLKIDGDYKLGVENEQNNITSIDLIIGNSKGGDLEDTRYNDTNYYYINPTHSYYWVSTSRIYFQRDLTGYLWFNFSLVYNPLEFYIKDDEGNTIASSSTINLSGRIAINSEYITITQVTEDYSQLKIFYCVVMDMTEYEMNFAFEPHPIYTLSLYAELSNGNANFSVYDHEENLLNSHFGDYYSLNTLDFGMNGYDNITLRVDNTTAYSLELFYLVGFNLPANRTEIDKYEFAYNSTGGRITEISGIVDWVNDTNSDDLDIKASGFDNELALYPSAMSVDNTLELAFDYNDGNFTEMSALVRFDNLSACRFYYVFYDENEDVKFTFLVTITGIHITGDDWDVGYNTYYSYTSDDFDNENGEFTLLNWTVIDDFRYIPELISFRLLNKIVEVDYNNTIYYFNPSGDDFSKIVLKMRPNNYEAGHQPAIFVDYVSIYVDGSSISNEGFAEVEGVFFLSGEDWNLQEFNFVSVTANPNYPNEIRILINDEFELINYGELTVDSSLWFNLYKSKTYEAPYLTIENNSLYEITNIRIYGIKLHVNEWEIYPTWSGYESLSTGLNNTYFYVENSRLKYVVYPEEVGMSSGFSLTFDIPNVLDTDYAFEFTSASSGDTESVLILDYASGADYEFAFSYSEETQQFNLGHDRQIGSFRVTIESNIDHFGSSGYIYNLNLIYLPDLAFSFLVSDLVSILIPLLILILVPFGFSIKLGRSAIIPIMVLMAFILAITSLMPAYLFFLILVGAFVYYLAQNKNRSD